MVRGWSSQGMARWWEDKRMVGGASRRELKRSLVSERSTGSAKHMLVKSLMSFSLRQWSQGGKWEEKSEGMKWGG